MPTLLRTDGFRFFFFSNEGQEPPHIHVAKADAYAKLWLQPIRLAHCEGFTPGEMRRMRQIAVANEKLCLEKWHEYFAR